MPGYRVDRLAPGSIIRYRLRRRAGAAEEEQDSLAGVGRRDVARPSRPRVIANRRGRLARQPGFYPRHGQLVSPPVARSLLDAQIRGDDDRVGVVDDPGPVLRGHFGLGQAGESGQPCRHRRDSSMKLHRDRSTPLCLEQVVYRGRAIAPAQAACPADLPAAPCGIRASGNRGVVVLIEERSAVGELHRCTTSPPGTRSGSQSCRPSGISHLRSTRAWLRG